MCSGDAIAAPVTSCPALQGVFRQNSWVTEVTEQLQKFSVISVIIITVLLIIRGVDSNHRVHRGHRVMLDNFCGDFGVFGGFFLAR